MTQTKAYCLKSPEGKFMLWTCRDAVSDVLADKAKHSPVPHFRMLLEGYRIVEVDVIERKGGKCREAFNTWCTNQGWESQGTPLSRAMWAAWKAAWNTRYNEKDEA